MKLLLLGLSLFLSVAADLGAQGVQLVAPAAKPVVRAPGEVATLAGVEVVGNTGPGSNVVVIVRVTLDAGAAIYSSAPLDRTVVPAGLYLSVPQSMRVLPIVYPGPRKQPIAGTPRERLVYEESVEIKIPLTMNNYVMLPATIPGVLNYQAVGKGPAILPPRQLKFTVPLPKPPPPPAPGTTKPGTPPKK